jgi:hypothetical protein
MSDVWAKCLAALSRTFILDLDLQVDPNPEGSAKGANLKAVARAAWAAAVLGLPELAEKLVT